MDWSKIDTWQKFQRLVNALFEMEMNSTNFKPSDPNIGRDAGQDAILRDGGNYEGKKGTFLIQSKYKKQGIEPKKAFQGIKRELKKEFKNYNKHNADCLFMCVNVSLQVTYQQDLEKLAQDNNVQMVLCDKEWLETKINKHPYLMKTWFDGVQNLSIEPPASYFEKYEKSLARSDQFYCEQRYSKLLTALASFIQADNKIFGIFSAGGEGKSHFLRKYSIDYCKALGRQIFILKDLGKPISEVFENELNGATPYLLIVDDFEKWDRDKTVSLIRHIILGNNDAKLLFTAKSDKKNSFSVLLSDRIDTYSSYSFSKWSEAELLELLHKFTGKNHIYDEKALVTRFNKPFYVELISAHISGRKHISSDVVFNAVLTRERRSFKTVFPATHTNINYDALLLELSLVLPVFSKQEIVDILDRHLPANVSNNKDLVDSLVDNGFLREVGRSYRFSPDMKGDIFIKNGFDVLKEDVYMKIFRDWFEKNPERVIKNLFYSANFEQKESSRIERLLLKIADEIYSDFNLGHINELSIILDKMEYLVYISPDHGIRLINDALGFIKSGQLKWNSDKLAPLCKIIMNNREYDRQMLEILFNMQAMKLDGYYDNQKPASLLAYFLSPAYFKIEIVKGRLQILLQQPLLESNLKLFSSGICELLSGAYEHKTYMSFAISIGAVLFNITPDGLEIRDLCIKYVCEKLFSSREQPFIDAGFAILDGMDRMPIGGVSLDEPRVIRSDGEKKQFIDFFNSEAFAVHSHRVARELENLLLRWWCHKYSFNADIEACLLKKIPSSLEYMLYKYSSGGYPIILVPFSEYYKNCPADWRQLLFPVTTIKISGTQS